MRLEVEPGEASEIGLRVRGEPIRYLVKDAAMVCGEGKAPAALEGGRLKLRVLVDRVSLESFAQDGKATISAKFMPKDSAAPLELYAVGGKARLVSASVWELNSAWARPERADHSRANRGFLKLGPVFEPKVDIDQLAKDVAGGKLAAQNWRLLDDAVVNWRKDDRQDDLWGPDQTAVPAAAP